MASLVVNVTRVNQHPPVISSSTGQFDGYMYENSPKESFLLNLAQDTPVQLSATDSDQVIEC